MLTKFVPTTTSGVTTATVAQADLFDVLNPTVPLADNTASLVRVGIYALIFKIMLG